MSTEKNLRGWHSWWSVALALPIVIVSLTAIFIAHEDSLGLKAIPLPASMRMAADDASATKLPEVRALHRHADGRTYVATKYGLLTQDGAKLTPVDEFAGIEVRGLATAGATLFAATKNGVWALRQAGWERVLTGEAWAVNALPDRTVSVGMKKTGLVVSADDGRTWRADQIIDTALADYAVSGPPPRMTLHKLIMDMHTGKAFFGKEYEWLWIDLVGGTMLFLSFSGLVMWWRARRQRLRLSQATTGGAVTARP